MRKRWTSLFLLSFSSGFFLVVLTQARADFVIKFTDGGQVTVHRYVEEGQSIKVYTPQGTISFRKDEVERITEVDAGKSMSTPLEAVSTVSTSSTDAKDSNKTIKPEEGKTAGASDTSSAAIERIDGQYQEVEQEFNKLWEKHVQDVDSGASEEVLSENRDKLNQLSNERHKLVEDARRAVPDELPAWAQ
jgi:hypothetical protein